MVMAAHPKLNLVRDRKYLDWLRTQPCLIEGTRNPTVEAAHISTAGKGIKSGDDETIPLSHEHHAKAHSLGEVRYLFDHLPLSILRTMVKMYAREMYRKYKHETN